MYRFFENLTPVRDMRWARAVKRFMQEQAEQGIIIRDREVPQTLASVKTVVLDAPLVLEGQNAVRMAAAPLSVCPVDRLRRQGSWMMLTAGVALGCGGYAPLEHFAREMNFEGGRMAQQYPRVSLIEYDDERRIETTVHRDADGLRAYAKGEPEAVLKRCGQVLDGREREMTDSDRQQALRAVREMESAGLETLAFSTKWQAEAGPYEEDMVFVGVVGMGDMPLPEAVEAVRAFQDADVRTVLVSEASPLEGAVRASGVLRPGAGVLYASQVEALDAYALREAAGSTDAFLGVTEAQRGRILRALRAEGMVATIQAQPEGGLCVFTGRSETSDAAVRGGLLEIIRLLVSCKTLYEEHIQGAAQAVGRGNG